MAQFNTSQRIGDIVALFPKGGEVFKKFNIDFCCGGNRPLSEAIQEQGLDEKEIINKLEEAYSESKKLAGEVDFLKMESRRLIEYIVNTHHAYLNRVLPEIGELTAKVLRAHGANHQELFRVHKLFGSLKTELEEHLIKEEELLFPLLKEYENDKSESKLNNINRVMQETENEHEGAGDILKELRKITDNYSVPADGCRTFQLAYYLLEELEGDLFQHIHLENNILFKRFI
ncbi:MAG: iron-sulfur cluster repair di-iron protein [Eubacterium sp.]|nr:iron-sulfur cluster repair di-iron protein [Eubacterium sp.]